MKKDVNKIVCDFCGKICKNNISKSAHQRFCKLNPNYKQNIKHHTKTVSLLGNKKAVEVNKRKFKNDPLNQIKKFELICEKCRKVFYIEVTINQFNSLQRRCKLNRFCSRSCANTRIHNKETKEKISDSLRNSPKQIRKPKDLQKAMKERSHAFKL